MSIEMIPLVRIKDPQWNSRLVKQGSLGKAEQAKLQLMAAEFNDPKVGQVTPIDVEDLGDGWYELVSGSRRRNAAAMAGWKEIRAEVKPATSVSDRIYRNIIENQGRENLTTFETARAAAQLRDLGLKNPEIAPKLHVAASHVSNLNAAYTGLPAPVLKEWEAQNPVATIPTLLDIARNHKTEDEKVRAWDEKVAESAEREAAGNKPGGRGKAGQAKGSSASYPVSQKKLGHLLTVLSSVAGSPDLSPDLRKWGKNLLDYVVQARETPPQGVPKFMSKGDAAKEEKAAAKAAEKAAKAAKKTA